MTTLNLYTKDGKLKVGDEETNEDCCCPLCEPMGYNCDCLVDNSDLPETISINREQINYPNTITINGNVLTKLTSGGQFNYALNSNLSATPNIRVNLQSGFAMINFTSDSNIEIPETIGSDMFAGGGGNASFYTNVPMKYKPDINKYVVENFSTSSYIDPTSMPDGRSRWNQTSLRLDMLPNSECWNAGCDRGTKLHNAVTLSGWEFEITNPSFINDETLQGYIQELTNSINKTHIRTNFRGTSGWSISGGDTTDLPTIDEGGCVIHKISDMLFHNLNFSTWSFRDAKIDVLLPSKSSNRTTILILNQYNTIALRIDCDNETSNPATDGIYNCSRSITYGPDDITVTGYLTIPWSGGGEDFYLPSKGSVTVSTQPLPSPVFTLNIEVDSNEPCIS